MTKPVKLKLIFFLVGLTFFIIIGIWLYIPVFFEKIALPGMFKKAGVELLTGDVQHIGLSEAEIHKLAIKTDDGRYMSIDNVKFNYSLKSLLRKQVATITLSGLLLEVSHELNQIRIGKFLLPNKKSLYRSLRPSNHDTLRSKMPIITERIIIRQSKLKIDYGNQTWTAPFEIEISEIDLKHGDATGCGNFSINGNRVSFTASLSSHFKKLDLSITGKQIQLEKLTEVVGGFMPLQATGPLDIQCNIEMLPETNCLLLVDLLIHLKGAALKFSNFTMTSEYSPSGEEYPLRLHFQGDANFYKVRAKAGRLHSPVKVRINEIEGNVRKKQSGFYLDAIVHTQIEKLFANDNAANRNRRYEITKPVQIDWHIEAQQSKDKSVHWSLNRKYYTTDPPLKIEGVLFGRPLFAELKNFFSRGNLSKGKLDFESDARLEKMEIEIPKGNFECFNVKMCLKMNLDFSHKETVIDASIDTSSDKIYLDANGIKTSFQLPKLSSKIDNRQSDSWRLNTKAFISGSWIKLSNKQRLGLAGLDIRLPLELSKGSNKRIGSAKIKNIIWNKKHIGSLEGQLHQEENNVVYKGKLFLNKLSEPVLTINGNMSPKGFLVAWYKPNRQSFGIHQPQNFDLNFAGLKLMGISSEDSLCGKVVGTFHKK